MEKYNSNDIEGQNMIFSGILREKNGRIRDEFHQKESVERDKELYLQTSNPQIQIWQNNIFDGAKVQN